MRLLIRGTEVTDRAARFFIGAGAVEGDQTVENGGIGERGIPAIRGGNGGVEFVVELAQDGDESLIVNGALLGRERFLWHGRPAQCR